VKATPPEAFVVAMRNKAQSFARESLSLTVAPSFDDAPDDAADLATPSKSEFGHTPALASCLPVAEAARLLWRYTAGDRTLRTRSCGSAHVPCPYRRSISACATTFGPSMGLVPVASLAAVLSIVRLPAGSRLIVRGEAASFVAISLDDGVEVCGRGSQRPSLPPYHSSHSALPSFATVPSLPKRSECPPFLPLRPVPSTH
jgi:hypothetical protein